MEANTLIKCPACGKDISNNAAACPNCGQPMEKKTPQNSSKRNSGIALIVVGILIFIITCVITIPMITKADSDIRIYKANVDIYKYGLGSSYTKSSEWQDKVDKTETNKTICFISLAVSGVIMALCIVGGKIVMSSDSK